MTWKWWTKKTGDLENGRLENDQRKETCRTTCTLRHASHAMMPILTRSCSSFVPWAPQATVSVYTAPRYLQRRPAMTTASTAHRRPAAAGRVCAVIYWSNWCHVDALSNLLWLWCLPRSTASSGVCLHGRTFNFCFKVIVVHFWLCILFRFCSFVHDRQRGAI